MDPIGLRQQIAQHLAKENPMLLTPGNLDKLIVEIEKAYEIVAYVRFLYEEHELRKLPPAAFDDCF